MVSLRIRALRLIEEQPGLSSTEIADRLEEPIYQTCAVLTTLNRKRDVRRQGRGLAHDPYRYWPYKAAMTTEEQLRMELTEAQEQAAHYKALLARVYRRLDAGLFLDDRDPLAAEIAQELNLKDLVEAI